MQRILVTGFDPFGGQKINPAWEAVSRIQKSGIDRMMIPTVYQKAAQTVIARAQETKPDAILLVGQAGGRRFVTPEYMALNMRSCELPDNEGQVFRHQKIVPDAPDILLTKMPVDALARSLSGAGFPAAVSYSAGTFVCNDTYFLTMHALPETPVLFVHVPYLPQQALHGEPLMPLETITDALCALLAAIRAQL